MSEPTTTPAPPVVYRPLSLVALVGAGLAGLFAAVVVIGGLVAFFSGDPWLLPVWSALVPITAGVLSALGLVQIQRSEGTLAGEKLARWGLALSVVVGLGYWAYVGTTYFAISREAEGFGRGFLEKLTHAEVLSAFRYTLPPGERPADDANLRDQVEGRFNSVGQGGTKGAFANFSQAEYVRVLGIGGTGTTFESLGVEDCTYTRGGYQVRLLYQVSTPQTSAVLDMTLQASEGKRSEGRRWQVLWEKTGMRRDLASKITDEGASLFSAARDSGEFLLKTWNPAIEKGELEEAFLQTLPPAEREGTRKAARERRLSLQLADGVGPGALPGASPGAVLPLAGLAADEELGRRMWLPGFAEFRAGGLVRADKGVFWAPPESRDEMIQMARDLFHGPNRELAMVLTPEGGLGGNRVPVVREEGGRFIIGHDVTLRIPVTAQRYMIDGRLLVACDSADPPRGTPRVFQVLALELLSGRSMPTGMNPRQMMRPR
jgi:hypothetical protein